MTVAGPAIRLGVLSPPALSVVWRSEPVAFAPYPLPLMPLSLLSRDAIAAQLRTGENARLPLLSEAGKRSAESCATLLKHGCPLPLWALA